MPSIRPLVSPESLYKDHEASYSMAKTDGLSDDQLHTHVDDNLILAASGQEAKLWGELAVVLLEGLGFTVNHEKSNLGPSQETQFLGFMINTRAMTISVPADKLAGIRASATCLKQRSLVSGRSLAMFIGTATSMKLAIPPAPLFYRALQTAKNLIDLQAQSIDSPVQLGPAQWEELTWWIEQAQLWNSYSLRPPKQVLMIQTDASRAGWGAVCQGRSTGGPWSLQETQYHINYMELLAVFLAIQTFVRDQRELTVLVQTDNVPTMTYMYIDRRGGTHSNPLTRQARTTWTWCMERKILLQAEHIAGNVNTRADKKS